MHCLQYKSYYCILADRLLGQTIRQPLSNFDPQKH